MPSKWYPICGNGYRNQTDGEEWDDNNSMDEDGWSSECKIETNYKWSNATGADICTTPYSAPEITSLDLDTEKLQITIGFNQIMMKQELTNDDMELNVEGINEPYSITWSAYFDKNKLIVDFTCSPALIGGSNEEIFLDLIKTKKFKSLYEIPLLSSVSL